MNGTYETFSQRVETLLRVPTNATGANQRTMSAMLPIHDVTYRIRFSYAPSYRLCPLAPKMHKIAATYVDVVPNDVLR